MLKTAGIRLNDLTKILMEKKNISFSDAFTIVQNENSELAEVYSWELQHLGNFNEKNAHDWQIYYSMVAEKLHVLAKKKESEGCLNFSEALCRINKENPELSSLHSDIIRFWTASNYKNKPN